MSNKVQMPKSKYQINDKTFELWALGFDIWI
jgi:hypothetical protein